MTKAHEAVMRALKERKIYKPNACECCNKQRNVVAHHRDYSEPLSVAWLCRSCHGKEHSNNKQRRFMPDDFKLVRLSKFAARKMCAHIATLNKRSVISKVQAGKWLDNAIMVKINREQSELERKP